MAKSADYKFLQLKYPKGVGFLRSNYTDRNIPGLYTFIQQDKNGDGLIVGNLIDSVSSTEPASTLRLKNSLGGYIPSAATANTVQELKNLFVPTLLTQYGSNQTTGATSYINILENYIAAGQLMSPVNNPIQMTRSLQTYYVYQNGAQYKIGTSSNVASVKFSFKQQYIYPVLNTTTSLKVTDGKLDVSGLSNTDNKVVLGDDNKQLDVKASCIKDIKFVETATASGNEHKNTTSGISLYQILHDMYALLSACPGGFAWAQNNFQTYSYVLQNHPELIGQDITPAPETFDFINYGQESTASAERNIKTISIMSNAPQSTQNWPDSSASINVLGLDGSVQSTIPAKLNNTSNININNPSGTGVQNIVVSEKLNNETVKPVN